MALCVCQTIEEKNNHWCHCIDWLLCALRLIRRCATEFHWSVASHYILYICCYLRRLFLLQIFAFVAVTAVRRHMWLQTIEKQEKYSFECWTFVNPYEMVLGCATRSASNGLSDRWIFGTLVTFGALFNVWNARLNDKWNNVNWCGIWYCDKWQWHSIWMAVIQHSHNADRAGIAKHETTKTKYYKLINGFSTFSLGRTYGLQINVFPSKQKKCVIPNALHALSNDSHSFVIFIIHLFLRVCPPSTFS